MDPDEALRNALSSPDQDERQQAAVALHGWLTRGGFPPSEKIVRECGIDRRVPLLNDRTMYLERYRSGWMIGYRPYMCPHTYVRLRKA